MAPLGSCGVKVQPGIEIYPISIPVEGVGAFNMTLKVIEAPSQVPPSVIDPQSARSVSALVSEDKGSDISVLPPMSATSQRHRLAIQARTYLDEHSLLHWVQEMLQDIIRDKPVDPWAYINEHTSQKSKKMEAKDPAEPLSKQVEWGPSQAAAASTAAPPPPPSRPLAEKEIEAEAGPAEAKQTPKVESPSAECLKMPEVRVEEATQATPVFSRAASDVGVAVGREQEETQPEDLVKHVSDSLEAQAKADDAPKDPITEARDKACQALLEGAASGQLVVSLERTMQKRREDNAKEAPPAEDAAPAAEPAPAPEEPPGPPVAAEKPAVEEEDEGAPADKATPEEKAAGTSVADAVEEVPAPQPEEEPMPTTELTEGVPAGSTTLPVAATDGFAIGDPICIASAAGSETNAINGFGSIALLFPLQLAHPPGTSVSKLPLDDPRVKALPAEFFALREGAAQAAEPPAGEAAPAGEATAEIAKEETLDRAKDDVAPPSKEEEEAPREAQVEAEPVPCKSFPPRVYS